MSKVCKGPCFCTGECRMTDDEIAARREFMESFDKLRDELHEKTCGVTNILRGNSAEQERLPKA